jgi:hypothetical protein
MSPAHAVGFKHQCELEKIRRNGLVIPRAVLIRRTVDVAAGFLQRSEIIGVVVLRTLKHHVLEEMGKAGASGFFVLRSDVIPGAHGDDRRRLVLMKHDPQAVLQLIIFYGTEAAACRLLFARAQSRT